LTLKIKNDIQYGTFAVNWMKKASSEAALKQTADTTVQCTVLGQL